MATPFEDYVINDLATPYHWWRMDSVAGINFVEFDLGDCAAGQEFDFNPGASVNGVVMLYRQAGLLLGDSPSYCAECTGAGSTGQPLTVITTTRLWFADETRGSIVFFLQGTASASENYMIGTHPSGMQFALYTTASGELVHIMIGGANATTFFTSGAALNDNQRHMIAIVCDTTGTNKLYIDGAEVAWSYSITGAGLGTAPWMASVRASASGTIIYALFNSMRYATPSFNRPWVGKLDEIMFYSESLTAAQVLDLWLLSLGITPAIASRARYPRRRSIVA